MALLAVTDLCVNYGEIEALRGLSLAVEEGAVVTLLGANGAGKSTTLRAISGLIAPRSGSIVFDGKPIAGLAPRTIVKLGVAHVPEGRRVFPGLTLRENIMLGASNGNASSAAIRREADAMLELFPAIRPFADRLGWTLSAASSKWPRLHAVLWPSRACSCWMNPRSASRPPLCKRCSRSSRKSISAA